MRTWSRRPPPFICSTFLPGLAGLLSLASVSPVFGAVATSLRPWIDYRTIMWVGDTAGKQPEKLPLFFQRLREMGINTAMVYDDGNLQPLLDNHFPYYVENIVNRGLCLKFNSNVRDWDKFVTGWAKEGRPDSALQRDYCLDAPEWRAWARDQMQSLARKNRDYEPLAYNIRDELSTTISANPFDYDFNPVALARFRDWLKARYGGLGALNAEWETPYASWDDVIPFTTDRIKNRMAAGQALPRGKPDWSELQQLRFDLAAAHRSPTRWNFSPWADFRSYMDGSLAQALDALRQAARELDPRTPVGVEGTQMPHAFGGYDLWRLSQALDWVEPYDIGCAREIFGSFMPGKPLLTTVFESQANPAGRRLWHLLLEGDRGCLVWWSEDCIDWKTSDYQLTPKAKALTPVLEEMTSPLARLFLRAERDRDPIFVHYSQPSIQVDWLLESTVDGSTWLRRFSSFEAEHNRLAKVRNAWLKAFQDLGFSPQFVSSEQIEQGALPQAGTAVLVLPGSYALSDLEARRIKSFLATDHAGDKPHKVFADGLPGTFDEHGKLRTRNALEAFEGIATNALTCMRLEAGRAPAVRVADITAYAAERRKADSGPGFSGWLRGELAPVQPEVSVSVAAHLRVHRFHIGDDHLITFERNIDYQMSEDLKQAGGNESFERPIEVEATLKQPAHVYDLRAQKYLGHTGRLHFTLDPWQPSLFALTQNKYAEESLIVSLARERPAR
ncbi:MAG TPA: beta-galactosidase [Candidatus Binatia bacterium]|nr:beta-galactosidase [Candidatus Binatia bacterium]